MDAFGKIDGAFTLEVLKVSAIPTDIVALGTDKNQPQKTQTAPLLAVTGNQIGGITCR